MLSLALCLSALLSTSAIGMVPCGVEAPPAVEENLTPGLPEKGEVLAKIVKANGTVLGEKVFNGRKFTLIQFRNIVGLFNEKGHVVILACTDDSNLTLVFSEEAKIDINEEGPSALLPLDGVVFTIKILGIEGSEDALLLVFDDKGQVIFGILNPAGIITAPLAQPKK